MPTVESKVPNMIFLDLVENERRSFLELRWARPADPTESRCAWNLNLSPSGPARLSNAFEHALRATASRIFEITSKCTNEEHANGTHLARFVWAYHASPSSRMAGATTAHCCQLFILDSPHSVRPQATVFTGGGASYSAICACWPCRRGKRHAPCTLRVGISCQPKFTHGGCDHCALLPTFYIGLTILSPPPGHGVHGRGASYSAICACWQ